ncbi:MAG: SdrD B-like domain-containing protein [Bacteroidota bacterium]
MKNLLFKCALLCLSLSVSGSLFAQIDCEEPECATNSINISTGVNHATGSNYLATNPATAQDAYWQLTAIPPGSAATFGPAWVIPDNYSQWFSTNNAEWLYAFRTSTQQPGVYTFERCFCLCEAGEIELDLQAYADDQILDIRLGGVSRPFNPAYDGSFNHMQNGVTLDNPLINLPAGRHCLEIDIQDVRGAISGLYLEGAINGDHLVMDECCAPTGSIGGFKFNDINGNEVWDSGEPAMAGWEINLNNGQASDITDVNGYYLFDNLLPGNYTVTETQQAGWQQTHPANNQGHAVTITGHSALIRNFGNMIPSTVSGKKFHDLNCDGERQFGEPFLVGWQIDIAQFENPNTPVQSTFTDQNGCFEFNNLAPGYYVISERMQTGWQQSFPGGDGRHYIEITEAGTFSVEFGNCLINDPDACCEEEIDELVVFHEDFEAGTNFTNDYSLGGGQTPGEFAYVNSTQAYALSGNTWDVVGYSVGGTNCDPNDQFMVVNGRTRQGGEAEVYRSSTLNTQDGERYSYCVRLKHLPQCAFDVVPDVRVEIVGVVAFVPAFVISQSPNTMVNTGPGNCDYLTISGTFTAVSQPPYSANFIRIYLDESGIGEGNDLAIDEIVVRAVPAVSTNRDISFNVDHTDAGNGQHNNTVIPTVPLDTDCKERWEVYEVDPADLTTELPGTKIIANASTIPAWGPGTHDFPGYNSTAPDAGLFQNNHFYVINRHVDCDCEDESTWTEIYSWGPNDHNIAISGTSIEEIQVLLNQERARTKTSMVSQSKPDENKITLQPNPFHTVFVIKFAEPAIQDGQALVYDMAGRLVMEKAYQVGSRTTEIDLGNAPAGTYFIFLVENGRKRQYKVIKQ